MPETLVEMKNITKTFPGVKALDNAQLTLYKGEVLGLLGENGAGKSTLMNVLGGVYIPDSGSVFIDGKEANITNVVDAQNLGVAFIHQEIALVPYLSVAENIFLGRERMTAGMVDKRKMYEESKQWLEMVGLNAEHATRNVHEFSGGQRQRIGIARALAVNPEFLFCDEPISALDVSIQAQIMNLLMTLQKERHLTMLFIAHDLAMVKHISDNIGVMYLGKLVEISPAAELYEKPYHPYTQALLESIPIADPDLAKSRGRHFLTGDVPSPIDPPKGCRFCGRCSKCMDICREVRPELKEVSKGHQVACHLYND